jgi:hypothetical protein
MNRNFHGMGRSSSLNRSDIRPQRPLVVKKNQGAASNWHQVWSQMVHFLNDPAQNDVRKAVCLSCGSARLWDRKGKEYVVDSRKMGIEQLHEVVAQIRKANAEPTERQKALK